VRLHHPVEPLLPYKKTDDLVKAMGKGSFQARSTGDALKVWKSMLSDNTVIMLGLAGAMVPGGMRRIIAYLIRERLIDCLVSTGANLFHDLHEIRGLRHWQGDPLADDTMLREEGIDRIYDTYADDNEFLSDDACIAAFARKLDRSRPYTTREFFYLLGQHLAAEYREDGILTSAAAADVPVYCPAMGDSSYGLAMAADKELIKKPLLFDVLKDVRESAAIACAAEASAVIYIGGGTPKNFIQQTEVYALITGQNAEGHRYAVQITADAPHWGGLSGCTFNEAQSWGKISKQAATATVYADATLALPLIVSALSCEEELIKRRARPSLMEKGRLKL
jgi:deoxyhypusine synthase